MLLWRPLRMLWCIQIWFNQLYAWRRCSSGAFRRVDIGAGGPGTMRRCGVKMMLSWGKWPSSQQLCVASVAHLNVTIMNLDVAFWWILWAAILASYLLRRKGMSVGTVWFLVLDALLTAWSRSAILGWKTHLSNPDLWGICSCIGHIVCHSLNVQLEKDVRVQAVNRNFCPDWFNHLTLILFKVIYSPILVWC